jgi:hypothetical protein
LLDEHPTLSGNIKKQYINRIQQILNEIVSQRRMATSNFLPQVVQGAAGGKGGGNQTS